MTTRRAFLKQSSLALAGGMLAGSHMAHGAGKESTALAKPTPAQLRWQKCEIGIIYHFDLPLASGEFAPNNQVRRALDPAGYNPTQLDTDQWLEAAKAIGAKYAVFTATHFNGFMQWQSDLYPYGVKQSKWRGGKGDVVHNWFWKPGQDENIYTCEQLETIYDQSVGRNCNLVIGEVITSDGLVPEGDIERLAEFGQRLRDRFAKPAGMTDGTGTELELKLARAKRIDQVVLAEDIAQGERVREYRVEGLVGGDSCKTLATGQSIGHKWIHRFEPTEVARLRLTVSKSAAPPVIRAFAAY